MANTLTLDLEGADPEIVEAVSGYAPGTKATITVEVVINEVSDKMLDASVTSITDIETHGEGGEEAGKEVEVTEEAPPSIMLFAKKESGKTGEKV